MEFKIIKTKKYHSLNAHNIGSEGKELIYRLMDVQLIHYQNAQKEIKGICENGEEDKVSVADREGTLLGYQYMLERFQDFAILGEEHVPAEILKHVPTIHGARYILVLDPLDGTSAYLSKATGGFGPMLALVEQDDNGQLIVIAFFIGDTVSGDIYYKRPESQTVHRYNRLQRPYFDMHLNDINRDHTLKIQPILTRVRPHQASPIIKALLIGDENNDIEQLCEKYHTSTGGVGLESARVWNGTFGGMVLDSRVRENKLHDIAPVIGGFTALGFDTYRTTECGTKLFRFELKPKLKPKVLGSEVVFFHQSRRQEINHWLGYDAGND